jgi:acyl-CoA synthetase (AMP-forming)/AMP-acid ligase II
MSEPVFPDYPPTVGNAVRDSARRFGDADFLVTPEERLSFADLDRRSRHLAARLVADGVTKGSRVAVLFPNGPDWAVTWAAATRIGAVVVPVSTFYKAFELGRFLRHSDVNYLVGVPRFLANDYAERMVEVAPELAEAGPGPLWLPSLPQLRGVFFFGPSPVAWARGGYGDDLDRPPEARFAEIAEAMEADVTPADPMLLMYTSGSTADPKGVLHAHGSTTRHAVNLAARTAVQPGWRLWTPMPFFWIGGFHTMMFRVLVSGATLVTQAHLEPGQALRLLAAERVTHVMSWPATTKSLVDHPDYPSTDLSSVIAGTMYDKIPADRRPPRPELSCNSLGMTETCGPHSGPTHHEDLHGVPEAYIGTFGTTVPGVSVRIVDPETNEPLPEGREGEVVVRGYTLMLGIYKQERADTFDADGWYHTQDRGYHRDGWLFFTGRHSDMIKTGGSNVAPAEVELCLMGCPEIMRAFVFGVPDPTRGQEVVALVQPWSAADGTAMPLDLEAVTARLKDQLSSFKVPRRYFVIGEDDVAWLPSQKADRRALAALAEKLAAEAG